MSLWGRLRVAFKAACHNSGSWLLASGFRRLQDGTAGKAVIFILLFALDIMEPAGVKFF